MFFGKKKDEGNADGGKPGDGPVGFSPEKARKFFEHAKTQHETGAFEYAMQLWLSGLRFDPGNMDGLKAFFASAAQFMSDTEKSKKGPGKDLQRSVEGRSDVDKYMQALLDWSVRPFEAQYAVKAMEGASKLRLTEPTVWIGERAYGATLREKKVREDLLRKITEYYRMVNEAERAVGVAAKVSELNPADGEWQAFMRNLAAQATMNKGGYDKPGQEGEFRKNIRDAGKQRILEEADRISKTEDTMDRLIRAAEEDMAARPADLPAAEILIKRLLERGKGTDEARALDLLAKTHASSNQFRFREWSGDVRIRQGMRKVRELEKMLEKDPASDMLKNMLSSAQEDQLALEIDEYRLRVQNYPTDLHRKFELGRRLFQAGKHDEAIGLFQEAQVDAKIRVACLNYLGLSFQKIGYSEEAVQTFKAALDANLDMSPETNLDVRYNLMLALIDVARTGKNADAAREADKLASSIAMKQFNFRDIRARRDEIKGLLSELASA